MKYWQSFLFVGVVYILTRLVEGWELIRMDDINNVLLWFLYLKLVFDKETNHGK